MIFSHLFNHEVTENRYEKNMASFQEEKEKQVWFQVKDEDIRRP